MARKFLISHHFNRCIGFTSPELSDQADVFSFASYLVLCFSAADELRTKESRYFFVCRCGHHLFATLC